MPPTAQATIEQLKAALLEHPFGSALQAAVWDAMDGGVPFPEIDEILDAKERKMLREEAESER